MLRRDKRPWEALILPSAKCRLTVVVMQEHAVEVWMMLVAAGAEQLP